MINNDRNILIKIIINKIRKSSEIYFSKPELKEYCVRFLVTEKELKNNILILTTSQRRKQYYYSKYFIEEKQKYIETNLECFINIVIKHNVKNNDSHIFTMDMINELSKVVGINPFDFTKYILKSNRFTALVRGDCNSLISNYYRKAKEIYFDKISEEINYEIMLKKVRLQHSDIFSYDEIKQYSNEYKINEKDFLGLILKNDKYKKKIYDKKSVVKSKFYKSVKEKYLKNKKLEILESIVLERISHTNSYRFDINDIKHLSSKYNINIRDMIVYILGRSDQLYHDIKSKRQEAIYSDDYKKTKEIYINKKKQEISYMFNDNKRTYYDINDIQRLSTISRVNIDDVITCFFDKTKKNLYNIKNNYRNRKLISYGEHKSVSLQQSYIQKNYYKLLEVVKISVKSACGYLKLKENEIAQIYEDLVQSSMEYLITHGNPYEDEKYMISEEEITYKEEHGKIFYTKSFYKTLTHIKTFLPNKVVSGSSLDIELIKHGANDDNTNVEVAEFIDNASNSDITRQILIYFSKNVFCDDSLNDLSEMLDIDKEKILVSLKEVKTKLKRNTLILEKKINR